MKFLITGGEGFIGRNLKEHLVHNNHEVETLDIEGDPYYKASILDISALRAALKDADGVFHLAAITSPPQFENDLFSGFNTNVNGTLNVLRVAAENNLKRAVIASSSAVYGDLKAPGREDMPIYGHENMYATTKLFDEYLGRHYTIRGELEVVSLRFFNTYGIGENSKGLYSSVISKFLESLSIKEEPLIYGNGDQSRDFIYVKDVAEAANAAMFKGIPGESYNIGTGISYSFNSIIGLISEVLNQEIKAKYTKIPFRNYQLFTQADMEKTFSGFGWQPKYDLKKGIAEMCINMGLL